MRLEADRRGVAADHFGKLGVVAHRGRDEDLAALVVIGDDSRHVGHVAAVVFEIKTAGSHHAPGEPHAHRLDQVRELVHEEVGVHAAAEVPVAAPLRVLGPVERHVGGQPEFGSQEHLPVDGLGVHVLGQAVIPPLAFIAVAVIAGLALHDVADLALGDHLVGHLPARVGGRLDAHREDPIGLLHRLGNPACLVDGVGHRLFAVDVLAGFHGVDRHPGVPVVRRGDQEAVDVLALQQAAVILGDPVLVLALRIEAAPLGRVIKAALDGVIAVPDVAESDDVDALGLVFEVAQDPNVLLGAAARAQDADVDALDWRP